MKTVLVAGVDEAGRGPLAGPVVAAAVILTKPIVGVTDSKKMTALQREQAYDKIIEQSLCFGIAFASVKEIDQLNILQATGLAMRRALEALHCKPHAVKVDGSQRTAAPTWLSEAQVEMMVKGDSRHAAIAAASVLAKVTRDRYMLKLDQRYANYGFASHKGYPTALHRERLNQYGPCVEHRLSFAPVRQCQPLKQSA